LVFREEGSPLYKAKTRRGDLNELRDHGFYRPDAPPSGVMTLPQSRPK
jgi:hypothetical protein